MTLKTREVDGEMLIELLRYIGYGKVTSVRQGVRKLPNRDNRAKIIAGSFVANASSNLVAMAGEEMEFDATDWLESFWKAMLQRREQLDDKDLVLLDRDTTKWIEQSRQLCPIIITEYGETLCESPDSRGLHSIYSIHAHDPDELRSCVHDICGGRIELHPASMTHRAIVCSRCGLRIVVPNEIETFGDLRRHFDPLQPKP